MGTITITQIKHNPKRSVVMTTEGREYGFWTDKAAKLGLEQGGTYNVETDSFETKNGTTLFNIISAKRVTLGGGAEPIPFQQRPPPPAASAAAPFCTPKQLFVRELLVAYIGAGKCAEPSTLGRAAEEICKVWDNVLDPVHYSEAAE